MHLPYESGSAPLKSGGIRTGGRFEVPVADEESAGARWHLAVGMTVLVAAVVAAVYYGGWRLRSSPRAANTPTSVAATTPVPAPALPASSPPPSFSAAPAPAAQTLPTATNPLRWDDLTLMLRTGFSDDDIIAATTARQWVVPLTPALGNQLRQMGAGNRLLANLRARPLYADLPAAAGSARTVPAGPALPITQTADSASPYPTPVDYVARDRKLAELKASINQLDTLIIQARSHPGRSYSTQGYGSLSTGYSSYAGLSLEQLEKKREELRREKWTLEGR